ncbi:hypothetical protein BDN71DRAFT_1511588 [Pleurotus eryngii]|uniref:Uncharacterized protein n=1 Tax=Pleurotus eryngii TaxID=5323 RepID=A0A9P5ZKR6_PLEER|nr:hypothetical protein BDN71DRAFT_1511588 [Pleurotus eryngii]
MSRPEPPFSSSLLVLLSASDTPKNLPNLLAIPSQEIAYGILQSSVYLESRQDEVRCALSAAPATRATTPTRSINLLSISSHLDQLAPRKILDDTAPVAIFAYRPRSRFATNLAHGVEFPTFLVDLIVTILKIRPHFVLFHFIGRSAPALVWNPESVQCPGFGDSLTPSISLIDRVNSSLASIFNIQHHQRTRRVHPQLRLPRVHLCRSASIISLASTSLGPLLKSEDFKAIQDGVVLLSSGFHPLKLQASRPALETSPCRHPKSKRFLALKRICKQLYLPVPQFSNHSLSSRLRLHLRAVASVIRLRLLRYSQYFRVSHRLVLRSGVSPLLSPNTTNCTFFHAYVVFSVCAHIHTK